eukprot:3040484-Karenia_brevis.AAC.1
MAPGGAASVAAANVAQRMADGNGASPENNGSSPIEPGSARVNNGDKILVDDMLISKDQHESFLTAVGLNPSTPTVRLSFEDDGTGHM